MTQLSRPASTKIWTIFCPVSSHCSPSRRLFVMEGHSIDEFVLPEEEKEKLKYLTVPVPENEARRIGVLQQTRLLDSSPNEPSFDRFTHLTSLIYEVRTHTRSYGT